MSHRVLPKVHDGDVLIDRSDEIADNSPMAAYGVAVADVHGDGRLSFVVTGFAGANRVLTFEPERSVLVDTCPPVMTDPGRRAIGVAAGDLDGDGAEEVYFLNSDTFGGAKRHADRLFKRFEDGTWVDLFESPVNARALNLTAGRSVAVIDRTGSGRYGFVVANYGGPMRLYELDEDGHLVDMALDAGIDKITGGRALIVGPLAGGDGFVSDLFANNEHTANFLFLNNGHGHFEDLVEMSGLADEIHHGRGVALVNGGDAIVAGNWEGPHRLWQRRVVDGHRLCEFEDVAPAAMRRPSRVRTVLAADLDNDGYEELLFNNIGEPNRLFGFREGHWVELDAGPFAEPTGLGTGAAIADVDMDGRLEILVAHGENALAPLTFIGAAPTDHAWLRVMPLTVNGAPARGATVVMHAGGRIQRRVIDGGSGYLCQMEPVAHFGLGPVSDIDLVVVTWPDGKGQLIVAPTAREHLVVVHPDTDEARPVFD